MRLTDQERRILSHAQLRADLPVAVLAKQLKMHVHTVRYCLDKLEATGVISPFPFINIYPLGFEQYAVFFSVAAQAKKGPELIRTLCRLEQVSWVLELAGDYQYGMAVCARESREVISLFDRLSERFGDIFFEKSLAVRLGWTLTRRKYLAPARGREEQLWARSTGSQVTIDETDHRILGGLSAIKYRSYRELATEIGVPQATMLRRIERLRAAHVIQGFAYGIRPSMYGYQPYRILVYLKSFSAQLRESLQAYCARQPHIFAVIECIGAWDFELKVECASSSELGQLIAGLYDEFGHALQTVKTLTVISNPKLQFYPFRTFPWTTEYAIPAKAPANEAVHFD